MSYKKCNRHSGNLKHFERTYNKYLSRYFLSVYIFLQNGNIWFTHTKFCELICSLLRHYFFLPQAELALAGWPIITVERRLTLLKGVKEGKELTLSSPAQSSPPGSCWANRAPWPQLLPAFLPFSFPFCLPQRCWRLSLRVLGDWLRHFPS